ncbi:sensor histidine kinase [Flavihumibacter sp. UBA7668]|uniref:sensor histidine kinase n=1 Tax=Flavihumibacter sp. UBA7668 TaxID=1946542 RepID=UPI0025B7C7C0|nr:histidine kinase [Flavihumibacter sp. UBA7668]
MRSQWYSKKWVGLSLHLLFWLILFGAPYLLQPVWKGRPADVGIKREGFYYLLFFNNLFRLLLFYCNAYILLPRLVYGRKYLLYGLILLAFFGSMFLVDQALFHYFLPGLEHHAWNFVVFNILPFSFIVIASAAYRIIRDRIKERELAKEKEMEFLKTELAFLRSQVSPHFMFNVLNNMVALARKGSDQLEPSLIKLSSLLRYMLYESDQETVPLQKEIDYLNSYIDLQRQRFGKKIPITVDFTGVDGSYEIPAMLLIPFVENAFKHGTGFIRDPQIYISLKTLDGQLELIVRNRYSPDQLEVKDKASGIGLPNTIRRLNLLFGKKHDLAISKEDDWYIVVLKLSLT